MGAAGRSVEVAAALGGAVLSLGSFGASLLRSLRRAGEERRRVAEALGAWDPAPGPAPKPSKAKGGRVFVLAGEPSGDRIAAGAAEALLRRNPGLEVRGFAGPRFAAAGGRLDEDLASDAVMGVSAVLRSVPRLVGLYARFLRILDEERPDAVLLVDYPGFNLRAAEAARRRGIPVAWYVVPQIWAWAPWRADRIGRAATDLCVVLPFERAFYASRGIPAKYVGYPHFEDREREAADPAVTAGLREGGRPVVAMLPGSRRKVVLRNLGSMLESVAILRSRRPGVRPVIACAGPSLRPLVDEAVRVAGFEVEVLDGRVGEILGAARVALCASGTATMECLHAGVPAVVAYQIPLLLREAMPFAFTAPHFTLANLAAGWEVFPEHLDPAGEAGMMARELEWLLEDGPGRDLALATLKRVRERLTAPGCHDRVAAIVEASLP